MKTTPTPWKVDGDDLWHVGISYNDTRDPHLYTGVSVNPELRESPIAHGNMELIVRAVNAHDDLLAVAKAYEQWEADIIMCEECWAPGGMAGLPRITQKLWDRLIEIQTLRNAAINKARNG